MRTLLVRRRCRKVIRSTNAPHPTCRISPPPQGVSSFTATRWHTSPPQVSYFAAVGRHIPDAIPTTTPPKTNQCCASVQSASNSAVSSLLSLLGIVLNGLDVPIGLSCSPVTVVGNNWQVPPSPAKPPRRVVSSPSTASPSLFERGDEIRR
ncbi:hypothetical protein B0H13DRAFT_2324806 [Mycena leptocephala]|nr:hypothetical protein B0H13DRAFT_2324806 [Mycena leptocephala]